MMFACVSLVCESPYGRRPVYMNLLAVNMSVYVVRPSYFPCFLVFSFFFFFSPRPVGDQLHGALAAWGFLHKFGYSSNTANAGFLEVNTAEDCVQIAVTGQEMKKTTTFFSVQNHWKILYRFSTDLLCTKHGNGAQKKVGTFFSPFLSL